MKKLVFSVCFIAVSAAYVVTQRTSVPDQAPLDADLLGDPAANASSQELLPPPLTSPAVLRLPSSPGTSAASRFEVIRIASPAAAAYADGQYTGPAANAYYGVVQIQAIVENGRVARLKVLQYPSDRQTSVAINRQALPLLRDEVIAAQSAEVDIVSGATLTSEAFIKSLNGALAQAR